MISIIINNNQLKVKKYTTVKEAIKLHNISLQKNVICVYIDEQLVDFKYKLSQDSHLRLVKLNDSSAVNIIRHSCAHLLAQAVKILFPKTKIAIGPVINNGFYYDFYIEKAFTLKNLELIEQQMKTLSKKNLDITRVVVNKEKAIKIFKNEEYKLKIINNIEANKVITCYKQGEFIDLCLGPHVPTTLMIKHFKLLKVSGAYWEGKSENKMLQRIYGTAWKTSKELETHLIYLQEIKKRDHRKVGKLLDLFHFHDEAPGVVFWHPQGWLIYQTIISYLRSILKKYDYQEVNTPSILNINLFERSGHISKFNNNIFKYKTENNVSVLKPMSCPCHIKIFNTTTKSYRDLPLKISEFGLCFRNEISGSLHGLMRLKSFVQDDGHIFCTENQVHDEIINFIKILDSVYKKFNFSKFGIKLSGKPKDTIVQDEVIWNKAEYILKTAIEKLNLDYTTSQEGAFYGPKIEFLLTDSFERVWQCGTIQIDFFTGSKLGAKYTEKNGKIRTPIILHRAILGSIERFIGILIENNNGSFPFWLSPLQIIIVTISNKHSIYAEKIHKRLKTIYKTDIDIKNDKLELKIRKYIIRKIPYIIILGQQEEQNDTITVRELNGNNMKNITLHLFMKKLNLIES